METAEHIIGEFRAAMADAGMETTARIRGDGSLERFHLEGDRRGTKNGWAVLHLDQHPAGIFGRWNTGLKATWSFRGAEISEERRAEWARRIEQARQQREAERLREADAAALRAVEEWTFAEPARPDHPYLVRKRVRPRGLRQSGAALLVPLRSAAGAIRGLQRIYPSGDKRFTRGMGKAGCYFSIGRPGPVLVLCEGVATGLSIHEATGLPVACAMDAGNLRSVALGLRGKMPRARFIFGADADDPGQQGAEQAAFASGGGTLLVPEGLPGSGKDWNDALIAWGPKAVRELFAGQLEAV